MEPNPWGIRAWRKKVRSNHISWSAKLDLTSQHPKPFVKDLISEIHNWWCKSSCLAISLVVTVVRMNTYGSPRLPSVIQLRIKPGVGSVSSAFQLFPKNPFWFGYKMKVSKFSREASKPAQGVANAVKKFMPPSFQEGNHCLAHHFPVNPAQKCLLASNRLVHTPTMGTQRHFSLCWCTLTTVFLSISVASKVGLRFSQK